MMTNNEIIAVVQAHKEGKQIQSRHLHDTHWMNNPTEFQWNFGVYDYRVAPEPQRFMKGYCFPCHINDRATIGMIKVEQVPFGEGENPIQPRKPKEWWIHFNNSGMHEVHGDDVAHCSHCVHVREVIKEPFDMNKIPDKIYCP